MAKLKKKTYLPSGQNRQENWYLIDARGRTLGRLSTRIARILQGKHKPSYTPHLLCGDKLIVINARYIKVSGKKFEEKTYERYSGYPSGRKVIAFKHLLEKNPSKIIYLAVKGMLPKNKLAKRMLNRLKVYPESEHPHLAQKPQALEV